MWRKFAQARIKVRGRKEKREEGRKRRRRGEEKKKKKQEDDTRQLISQCYFERTRGALSVFSERARN